LFRSSNSFHHKLMELVRTDGGRRHRREKGVHFDYSGKFVASKTPAS
jgi:hypothetical protein